MKLFRRKAGRVDLTLSPAVTAAVLIFVPFLSRAQPQEPPGDSDLLSLPAPDPSARGMPERITSCPGVEDFGGTSLERAGFCALLRSDDGRYVEVRTLADEALAADEKSFRAHYLMGVAQHLGEANLPKALFHLERSETLLVERHGEQLAPDHPAWSTARRVYLELVYLHGEMDHHLEKIAYVDRLQIRLGLDYSPLKAWPLMKLKRFEEARQMARAAMFEEEPEGSYWRAVGLTALCAIESEQRNREAAYEACIAAADPVRNDPHEGGVALSNAAAASVEAKKYDDAERYYVEATRRAIEGTINPWGRLVHLYLWQGRFSEALAALREMQRYRLGRPPYFDQQDQTDAELTGASLLMIAGRMKDVLRITSRTVNRPDRQGTSSASSDQNEAGNLMMDRVARLDVARRLEEEASWSSFGEATLLHLKAAKLRFEAWMRGRQAARLLADDDRIATTLRPECPGSIELAPWLDAEIISVIGSGTALAGIARGRQAETMPEELSRPVFASLEAEAHLLAGNDEDALTHASVAVTGFLPTEALLRARAASIGARAARSLGHLERAMELYQLVIGVDPGLIRRVGDRLPVELVPASSSPEVEEAVRLLGKSSLFEVVEWGFRLLVADDGVVLTLPDGSELLRARAKAGPKGDVEQVARRIVRAAHEDLLVPNVDLTQADIHSLDGGLGGGGRASERAKSVLEEVLGEEPAED